MGPGLEERDVHCTSAVSPAKGPLRGTPTKAGGPGAKLVFFGAAELMPESTISKTASRDPECVITDALWRLPWLPRRPPTHGGQAGAPVTMRSPRLCPGWLATRPGGV